MKIETQKHLHDAIAYMYKFHTLKNHTDEEYSKYLSVCEAIKNAPEHIKTGEPVHQAKVIKMTEEQEAEHKAKYKLNPLPIKALHKEQLPMKTKAQTFKADVEKVFKTKMVVADVQAAIEENLNTEIIDSTLVYSPVLEEVAITEASSIKDTQLIRLSQAQVEHKAEQDGVDPIQAQSGSPQYARPITQHSVIKSLQVISRETVSDPHSNILADVLAGIDESTLEQVATEIFAGVGNLGAEAELSGINIIKCDLANTYAEALKSDAARDVNVFGVMLSGIDNSIGDAVNSNPNNAVGNLINLVASLPVKFKGRAKWYMEPAELSLIMGLRTSDGALIFNPDSRLLLGFPVVEIDGFRPVDSNDLPVNDNDIRLAFGHLESAVAVKHVESKDSEVLLDEFSRDGGLKISSNKTYINYTKSNKSLRLLAAKA